jgi:lysophospholipase L1-like esterase
MKFVVFAGPADRRRGPKGLPWLLGLALNAGCSGVPRMPPRSHDARAIDAVRRVALTHTIGRFDTRDPAGPRLAWPGTAITAAFTGTGLDVRLRDAGTNFFAVAIDNRAPVPLGTGPAAERYTLASGLAPGRHTVVLTKRTESNVGVVQFLGFSPWQGVLLETPDPVAQRRIEFVGDSITCGYGDLGTDPKEHFRPETEDETIAYGALTAAAFGAERSVIAYSGMGMVRDHLGSTASPMPLRFERTLPDDPTSRWAFDAPAPDVVVVHLGGNDFAMGDPGPAFVRAYVAFLAVVRARYPNAAIVCALAPMLTDEYPPGAMNRTKAAAYIRDAVEQRHHAGDRRVSYFAFAAQRPSEGFGADYHPSAATQRRMAEELVIALRLLMGW